VQVEATIPHSPGLKVISTAAADSFDSCPKVSRSPTPATHNQSAKVEWHLGRKAQNATPAAEMFSSLT